MAIEWEEKTDPLPKSKEGSSEGLSDAVVIMKRPGTRPSGDISKTVHREAGTPQSASHTPRESMQAALLSSPPSTPPRALTRSSRKELVAEVADATMKLSAEPSTTLPPLQDGDVITLLRTLLPLVPGVRQATQWARMTAEEGDPFARTHAETLETLGKILAQVEKQFKDR